MARDTEYILKLLQEHYMVTREQVARARAEVMEAMDNGAEEEDLIDHLVKQGIVSEEELLMMLAQQYGMELLDLSSYEIPEEVLSSLSTDIVRHYNVVPVMKHDDMLTVAMSDPTDMEKLDTLRYLLGADVDAVVASPEQIQKVIDKHFVEDSVRLESMIEDDDSDDVFELVDPTFNMGGNNDDDNAPIIRLVTKLILDGYKQRASDIHFEPMEKRYRVRYRVDGALREVPGPPKYLQANFTSRMKIMSHLDITEKRIPQDGRIQLSVGDKDIDLRVSSIPTVFGESLVMRILDKASIQLDIPKLGFYSDDLELLTILTASSWLQDQLVPVKLLACMPS